MIKSVIDEIQAGKDYCEKCGCPKDICCGQDKISLEWLEKEIERMKKEYYPEPLINAKERGVLNDLLHTIRKKQASE